MLALRPARSGLGAQANFFSSCCARLRVGGDVVIRMVMLMPRVVVLREAGSGRGAYREDVSEGLNRVMLLVGRVLASTMKKMVRVVWMESRLVVGEGVNLVIAVAVAVAAGVADADLDTVLDVAAASRRACEASVALLQVKAFFFLEFRS